MPVQCLSNIYLWLCGTQSGFLQEKDGRLLLEEGGAPGYFVSRIYDSGEGGTEWNRLELDISPDVAFKACVWVADDMDVAFKACVWREEDARGARELYEYVESNAQYISSYRESLLYGRGCGRYARLAVKIFHGDKAGEKAFRGYRMSFPKESFTRYLPVIYQGNEQLERFLAVQESVYLDLERKIDSFAQAMDYGLRGGRPERLAQWLGWGDLAKAADGETLRRLLATGLSLISRKGTGSYYTELTELLTGKQAVAIEEPELHRVTLLIREQPEDGWEDKLVWLKKNAPIGVEMRFIVLHGTDRLDGQFFLDETAYLSETDSELTDMGINIDSIRLL